MNEKKNLTIGLCRKHALRREDELLDAERVTNYCHKYCFEKHFCYDDKTRKNLKKLNKNKSLLNRG